ncbi:beta-1,3-glucanase family protein, partial [Mycobacterium ulcerans]
TTPGHWAWIDQNGVAHPIDHNAADARGHLTKDGVNYANMSFTLDQAGNLTTPSEFQGGRVFISMKQPLYIAISPDNMGWAGPDPANP